MSATWVIAHSQRGRSTERGFRIFSPIRTVAGKADENGQSFTQGSRNSCGARPSVPALAHESEPNQCENAEKVGVYMTTPGIAIDWVVSRSSLPVKEGRLNVQSGHREVRVEH